MTRKQAEEDSAGRLTSAAVTDAALRVLEGKGLAGVSTRAVAERLGVRMNTVLGDVRTKVRMRELMADAVLGVIDCAGLPRLTAGACEGTGRPVPSGAARTP
ncbi:hypothetical protein GCM10010129_68190 [Streptomyces fumigatiscleroticus]|nr:hypothetical protein GCM10010129_68190 [Streptomyces fumigatiscleroticus]